MRGWLNKEGVRIPQSELPDHYKSGELPQGYSSLRAGQYYDYTVNFPNEWVGLDRTRGYFSAHSQNEWYCVTITHMSHDKNGINLFWNDPHTGEEKCNNVNPHMYVYVFHYYVPEIDSSRLG